MRGSLVERYEIAVRSASSEDSADSFSCSCLVEVMDDSRPKHSLVEFEFLVVLSIICPPRLFSYLHDRSTQQL